MCVNRVYVVSCMSDIRSYVNPFLPGTTEAGQRRGMTGELSMSRPSGARCSTPLLHSLRKGDGVQVMELYCPAARPHGAASAPGKRRKVLFRTDQGDQGARAHTSWNGQPALARRKTWKR